MEEKNLLKLLLIFVLAPFILLFMLGIFYISQRDIALKQNEGTAKKAVYLGNEQTSSYIYPKDNLYLVYLRMVNAGLENKDPLLFQLKEGGNVRKIKFSGINVGDDDWVKLQFAPLYGLKDKEVTLTVSSATQNPNNAVFIKTDSANSFMAKMYSKEKFSAVLIGSFKDLFSRLSFDSPFLTIYGLLLISATLLIVLNSRQKGSAA